MNFRKELSDVVKWSDAFQGLYFQATFLRSVCFPLVNEAGWEEDLEYQMGIHQKDFEAINKVIMDKMKLLNDSYVANGLEALKEEMRAVDGKERDGIKLMLMVYNYLNKEFNPGEVNHWKVVVIEEGRRVSGNYQLYMNGWIIHARASKFPKPRDCSESYFGSGTKYCYCIDFQDDKGVCSLEFKRWETIPPFSGKWSHTTWYNTQQYYAYSYE